MPTELCPAGLSVAAPALFGAAEEVSDDKVSVTGESGAAGPKAEKKFLAALGALLEQHLAASRTHAGECFPPAHGARERFAAEDLPQGLGKTVASGLERGASTVGEGCEDDETKGALLDGLDCAGNGIAQLLWSTVLLRGVGAEIRKEEPGSGRSAISQVLAASGTGFGPEGDGEAVPTPQRASFTQPEDVPPTDVVTSDRTGQGVRLDGSAASADVYEKEVFAEMIGCGRNVENPIEPAKGQRRESAAPEGVLSHDEAGESEPRARAAASEVANKTPDDATSREAATKEHAGSSIPRPAVGEQGEAPRPTAGAAAQALDSAQTGPASARGTAPETKAGQTASQGEGVLSKVPWLEAFELPCDADAGGDHGSDREPAKGEPGLVVSRSAATEILSNSQKPSRESEWFSKVLHTEAMDRIVERAVLGVRAGQREISIDLKPEFLGRVRLHISTDHQQVMVKMVAESTVTKELIESNVHQLRSTLQNQGLDIRGFDISLAHDCGRQGAGYEPRAFSEEPAAARGEEAAVAPSEEESSTSRIGTGRLGDTIDFFA